MSIVLMRLGLIHKMWHSVHKRRYCTKQFKALLKLQFLERPQEGSKHHSIACDSSPVQQIEQVSLNQCCDHKDILSQYVRGRKQCIMRQKGFEHETKQNRSH